MYAPLTTSLSKSLSLSLWIYAHISHLYTSIYAYFAHAVLFHVSTWLFSSEARLAVRTQSLPRQSSRSSKGRRPRTCRTTSTMRSDTMLFFPPCQFIARWI